MSTPPPEFDVLDVKLNIKTIGLIKAALMKRLARNDLTKKERAETVKGLAIFNSNTRDAAKEQASAKNKL